jgi:hypothetical protein
LYRLALVSAPKRFAGNVFGDPTVIVVPSRTIGLPTIPLEAFMNRFRAIRNALASALVLLLFPASTFSGDKDHDNQFNRKGNILIADQFNNRVIEVSPDGQIVWHFGRSERPRHTP